MPRPRQRTRSRKRVHKTLPGGNKRVHYKREVIASSHCYLCGRPLAGIPHLSTSEARKLNRSKRRVWRLYGGKVCHSCLKSALKIVSRTI